MIILESLRYFGEHGDLTDGWHGQTLKGDGHDSVFLNCRPVHGHRLRR